jgi:hypothetical protein
VSPRVREHSVHPRLQWDASGRPLNFTVRRLSVPTYDATANGRGISASVGVGIIYRFIVRAFGFFEVGDMLTDIAHEEDRLIFG